MLMILCTGKFQILLLYSFREQMLQIMFTGDLSLKKLGLRFKEVMRHMLAISMI